MEFTNFGQIAIYNDIFSDVSNETPKYNPEECIKYKKSYSVLHNKKEIPIMIGSNLDIHPTKSPLNISGYFIVDGICKSINNIKIMNKFRYTKNKAKLSDDSEIVIKNMFSILQNNKKFKLPSNWRKISNKKEIVEWMEIKTSVEGVSVQKMKEVDLIILRYLFETWLGSRDTPCNFRIMTAGELINISKNPIKYMKSNSWNIWGSTYNCISEDMKHNNIIGDIESIRKVTILKERESAGIEIRNTKDEDKYILSPIHTPDGKLCGTVRFLCMGVNLKLKNKLVIGDKTYRHSFVKGKYVGETKIKEGIEDGELYHVFANYGVPEHSYITYSYTESLIPFRLHNPPIRILFACSMLKQGIYGNYKRINDTKSLIHTDDIGFNLNVAIMPWYGYNVEDAIVISEKVAEMYEYKEVKIYRETCKILSVNVKLNDKIVPSQLLYKKYNEEQIKTVTLVYSEIEGRVTEIIRNKNYLEITIENIRKLEVGDKMTSRHGQKSIISLILHESEMPYTDTQKIDLIMNPHAFPSRMTMGQIKEMGDRKEIVYLPSGKQIKNEIIIGKCMYIALKHQVHNKMQFRNKGKYDEITKQPLKGRKVGGGLRVGQMERDLLLGVGAIPIIRWFWKSDLNGKRHRFYDICLSYMKALGYDIDIHEPDEYSIVPLNVESIPETNSLNFGDNDITDVRRINNDIILPMCLRSEKLELLYKRYDKNKVEKEIKTLLKGKNGAFHKYFEGHRIDQCVRSVIVPNPNLEINTIEIPYGVNIECEYGILNRQPTLNVGSMAIVKLKIGANKTIGINPLLCKNFNADFDGDEMNVYGLDKNYDILKPEPVKIQDYILGDLTKVTEDGITADRMGIIKMIKLKSKGEQFNYNHIYMRIGELMLNGKLHLFIESNYNDGLNENEWYECCKAAIESACSISINTPITGYLASVCNQAYL